MGKFLSIRKLYISFFFGEAENFMGKRHQIRKLYIHNCGYGFGVCISVSLFTAAKSNIYTLARYCLVSRCAGNYPSFFLMLFPAWKGLIFFRFKLLSCSVGATVRVIYTGCTVLLLSSNNYFCFLLCCFLTLE